MDKFTNKHIDLSLESSSWLRLILSNAPSKHRGNYSKDRFMELRDSGLRLELIAHAEWNIGERAPITCKECILIGIDNMNKVIGVYTMHAH